MNPLERIATQSPFPIVDLTRPEKPRDGIVAALTRTCHKVFDGGVECKRHYEGMADLAKSNPNEVHVRQCPFGFASIAFSTGDLFAALTGFVPFPRLGGEKERIVAKRHPESKFSIEAVQRAISILVKANKNFLEIEETVLKGHSMALHEIRKFNRTIKQTAERLCKRDSPGNPDGAQKELVTIYKTSELMSNEYNVIEILADASQAKLPPNTVSELYKIFDKCVKIYNAIAGGRRLLLRAEHNYNPRIVANDNTLPIIPSVFIDNALKYSLPGSEIRIFIEPDTDNQSCLVTVTNDSEGQQQLDDRIFQRGYRATTHRDGTGNGLYVAQLIAEQHNTRITVDSSILSSARVRHTFSVSFRTTNERWLKKR
jgi:signal transduction histidine kinase